MSFIKNNRIKLFSVLSVGIAAVLTFLLVFPTVTSTFASASAIPNRTFAQNDDGVIILKGATIIDGTGDLPKPNTTIIINGSRIASISNDTANSYDLNFSLAKNIFNLTGKYIIPGLFDMHAHVASVRKDMVHYRVYVRI